jgi:hypothetical protein
MDVLPLERGLRKVVIRQLKLLGIVGFPLPKYKAQNISAIAFSVISVRGDSAPNSFFEQRLAGVLCVSKYISTYVPPGERRRHQPQADLLRLPGR